MSEGSSQHADVVRPSDLEMKLLTDDGTFPNNESLHVLRYRGVFVLSHDDPAGIIEKVFRQNDWEGCWRNGIYSYHHYHSTAHEVLGVASGMARVQLGGDEGIVLNLEAGDALLIPAGVAHKNMGSSGDFLVVGAYPAGQKYDMMYGRSGERPRADRRIEQTPLPRTDPVFGPQGPLDEHWKS